MNHVILCDFDGTIITIDSAEFILSNYAKGNWKQYNDMLIKGEITLEQCLERQFSHVKISQSDILSKLEKIVQFRSNFIELLDFCEQINLKFIIVSAGLDFIINHFLALKNLEKRVEVFSPKSKQTLDGLTFIFPRIRNPDVNNFKEDIVQFYKNQNLIVSFIGDGTGDFHAIKRSDYRFVIKNSILAKVCAKHEIKVYQFEDFLDVINKIKEISSNFQHRIITDSN